MLFVLKNGMIAERIFIVVTCHSTEQQLYLKSGLVARVATAKQVEFTNRYKYNKIPWL